MTDLGPNQLAWLRENVPAFKPAEKQASEARRHSEEVERKVKGRSDDVLPLWRTSLGRRPEA